MEAGEVAQFVAKTYEMLSVAEFSKIICWGADGEEFVVRDVLRLEALVLPRYFRHRKISSFVRQLNMYGFQKTKHSPFRSTFRHPLFRSHSPHLLPAITRRHPHPHLQQTSPESTPTRQELKEKQQNGRIDLQAEVLGVEAEGQEEGLSCQLWVNLDQQLHQTSIMITHCMEKMDSCEMEGMTHWMPSQSTLSPLRSHQGGDCSQGGAVFEDPSCFLSSRWGIDGAY